MPETPSISTLYEKTGGLVLAGGGGARLGQARKADLMVGGHRLIDLACENLEAQCAHLTIAIGAHPQVQHLTPRPRIYIADPGQGPAAAVLFALPAVLKNMPRTEYLLVAPCDAPFMPTDFTQRAAQKLNDTNGVVVGAFAGRTYPTHALWKTSALAELQTHFAAAANPSLFALLDRVPYGICAFDRANSSNPFFNINSPADLIAANRRFAEQTNPSFS